ncbi:MAG: RluA family pseudouridine synthase [Deltaproteobacteria bacterium]
MAQRSCVVEASSAGRRLDVFITEREPEFSRAAVQALIVEGKAWVNGQNVKAHTHLKAEDRVTWEAPTPARSDIVAEDIPLVILHEDASVCVIDKPSGLVVHPGAGHREHTLVHALLHHLDSLSQISRERPGIVHRLDKETSGVMVVAKTNAAHLDLARQFKEHTIERRYVALVEGDVAFEEGVIDVPVRRHRTDRKRMSAGYGDDAKEAKTRYKVTGRFGAYTAVALYPETGRTHQLRVHLAHLGYPVLGDPVYGGKKNFSRLALHAEVLGFTHPQTQERMRFTSPIPREMQEAMAQKPSPASPRKKPRP